MEKLNPGASHNPIANDLQAPFALLAQKFADSIPHGHELGTVSMLSGLRSRQSRRAGRNSSCLTIRD